MQPHLGQRHPRPVAAAPSVHGGQPRPLDAAQRTRPDADRPPLRAAGAARGADPDGAAGRRGLRGRARPGGLAVRGDPRVRRAALLAGVPVAGDVGRRLVEHARAQAGPRRRGARRARRPAVVPVAAHLAGVRVPAAHGPRGRSRRRPGGRAGRRPRGRAGGRPRDRAGGRSRDRAGGGPGPYGARPARVLVRAPARGPAARRAHRRRPPHGRRRGRRPRGPLRPPPGRTRAARHAGLAPDGGAGRRGGRRGRGGLPPRPQRAAPRSGTRPAPGATPAAGRPGPVRPRPPVRRLVTPGLVVGRAAARGHDLRRHRPGPGPAGRRARRGRPPASPQPPRRPCRHPRPRRAGRRHAGLRAGRRDVRRCRPARLGLAGRHRHLHRRPSGPADLAGVRHPAAARRRPAALRRAGPAHLAPGPRRTGRHRERPPGRGRRPGPHPAHRAHPCPGHPHRPRAPPGRHRLRHHPAAGGRGAGGCPDDRPDARRRGAGDVRRGPRRRRDRAGVGVLAHRPRFHTVRHLGQARLQGRLRTAHHRHPVGRRHLLAPRRPSLRAALLRGARGARPHLADGHLDPGDRRAAGHLRAFAGQRPRRLGRLATGAVRPQTGRAAHLRFPAGAPVRPLVPGPLRACRARLPARGGGLLAQPVPDHRPDRRPDAPARRPRAGRGPRAPQGPADLRPYGTPPAARADPRPLRLPGRPGLRRGTPAAAGAAAPGRTGSPPDRPRPFRPAVRRPASRPGGATAAPAGPRRRAGSGRPCSGRSAGRPGRRAVPPSPRRSGGRYGRCRRPAPSGSP